jgi:1,4-dihydroxy-2-naphthoate polyprenyltransferase
MLSLKNENPTSLPFPGALKVWLESTRPKTLIASISPVLIGSAIASLHQPISYWVFILCLGFSICLQIAVNWANDYFDFIKGTDTPRRQGPLRAIHSGWIEPRTMRNAAFGSLVAAALFSVPLLARVSFAYWPFVLVCLLCAIFYTGGRRPLGYLGLGDLLVFAFYGPVATAGAALAQMNLIPSDAWIASIIPGSLCCAILCVNNLRDIEEDRRAKKMTLVARFGKRFGTLEYAGCLMAAMMAPLFLIDPSMPPALLAVWLLLPLAKEPLSIVFQQHQNLNRALALTARLLAIYTLLFCLIIYAHLHL